MPGTNCFDAVILGNVLCEVPAPAAVLAQVDRLLAPGGVVYFSEHVASPPGTLARRLQRAVQPWWGLVSDGCHCDRDTLATLAAVSGWDGVSWEYAAAPVLLGPFHVGLLYKTPARA